MAGQVGGDYGNPNGTMGTGSACGTTRFGYRLTVRNNQAAMRTVTAGLLEGQVAADGSISIQSGSATLTGKINGPKFNGDLSLGRAGNCRFALDYTKF